MGTLLVSALVLGIAAGADEIAQVGDKPPAPSSPRSPRPNAAPRVSASVNDATEAEVPQGWPMLLTAYLQAPRTGSGAPAQALTLTSPAGSWAGLLRIELSSANGQPAAWPWKPAYTPAASITLDQQADGQAMWFILGEQTATLPLGEYLLSIVLDAPPPAVPGAWQGTARSSLVKVTITHEPAQLTPELEVEKHLLRACVDLWRGAPGEALASAEALLAKQPENYKALTAKGDALRELGKEAEAGACYQQALNLFYKQNPKSAEPPILLMDKIDALSGNAPLGAKPAPATGPAPNPVTSPQAPPPAPGAAPAAAPELRFQLPAGWRRTDQTGEIVLVPPDIPPGETASLVIGKAKEMKTDLGAYFVQAWASQTRDTEVSEDSGPQAQPATGDADREAVFRAAWLKTKDGKRIFTLLVIARTGVHVFPCVYKTSSPEVLRRDQQVVESFFREISFGSVPPAR